MCKDTILTFELLQKFPNNKSARLYIEERRWYGKPMCPSCNNSEKITARSRKSLGYCICKCYKTEFTVRTELY